MTTDIQSLINGPISYSLAFFAGLLASGHCIGMCGALSSTVFIRLGKPAQRAVPLLTYQMARIGVYTLVGLAAAALGQVLISVGVIGAAQGALQLFIGFLVVLMGLDLAGLSPLRLSVPGLFVSVLSRFLTLVSGKRVTLGAMLAGMLNAFIPCPLTFAMAVKATTAPGAEEGALLLLAFGLGTLPSMLFVSTLFSMLGGRTRGILLRGSALILVVMGLMTAWQGFGFFNVMRGLV